MESASDHRASQRRGNFLDTQHHPYYRNSRSSYLVTFLQSTSFRNSILPSITVLCLAWTLWSLIVSIGYLMYPKWIWLDDGILRILTPTLTLLMTFRTNRAFERYWSGSQLWSNLSLNIRNSSRLLWNSITPKTDLARQEQRDVQRLLLAIATSMKWAVRGENGFEHPDVVKYLPGGTTSLWKTSYRASSFLDADVLDDTQFSKDDSNGIANSPITSRIRKGNVVNVPLDLVHRIAHYIRRIQRDSNVIVGKEDITSLNLSVNAMLDSITKFETILNITAMPLSYDVHMKQMLSLYLFFLPLQIVKQMKYMVVPTTLLVSWAFLGLDAIANEIEEPFGDDQNDLPLDYFVKKLQEDLEYTTETTLSEITPRSSTTLLSPSPLDKKHS